MKFTIISHACIYIEHLETRLLIDPWLLGSCYWRSWWNYPEPDEQLVASLKPTHIYISHLHWDHFHGPSLRSLHRFDPVILLPKSPTSRMISDIVSDFRFSTVKELIHGRKYWIGNDFCLSSYQFNPICIDSALAVNVGGVSLLNANDAKTFGWSLHHIMKNYPSFDFVFRSHSSASPYPYCFPDEDLATSERLPSNYSDDFIAFSEATNTKYVVPFASSHVYLHKDTFRYNKHYNSPLLLKKRYEQFATRAKLVLMPAGSSWSIEAGFSIKPHDYADIPLHLESMARSHQESLDREYRRSLEACLKEEKMDDYFSRFSRSVGLPFRHLRFGFFVVASLERHHGTLAIIDTKKSVCTFEKGARFSRSLMEAKNLEFIIKIPCSVLNDCVSKAMFSTFAASKLLLAYERRRGKAAQLLTMLDLFENEMLPIWKAFSPRQFSVWLMRFRELFDMAYFAFVVKVMRLPLFRLWSKLPTRLG